MKKVLILLFCAAFTLTPIYAKLLSIFSYVPRTIWHQTHHPATHKIQIALLLDTSNSMDGLIDQAKSQLWKMVNDLSTAHKDGHQPTIELALYHYGNSTLSGASLFVKRLTPFTKDLDLVSEQLFALRTNGGNEYCGAVIKNSIEELEWSQAPKDLKLIIIAGNEPFNQGPVDFQTFCQKARNSNIQINTIFCGDYLEGKQSGWKTGAELAEGKYLNIDQDQKVIHIKTPYDERILELNIKLNNTYLGYGSMGAAKMENQRQQDANALSYGASNARTRAAVKAKKNYNNSSWDLVDALEEEAVELDAIPAPALPEQMQHMDKKEQLEYVQKIAVERKNIQAEILSLEKLARSFEEKERLKVQDAQTLDNVLIQTVKEQAIEKEYQFE